MRHPEVVLVPILVFLDYFLTVFCAIQKDKKYSDHFNTPHYELNPRWQKQISQKKWFNPRHIILTVILAGVLICVAEFGNTPESFLEGLFGCLFVFFGMLIGRHLSNIMIFRYLAKKPNEISGQITMAHSCVLSISTYSYFEVAVPMILVAVFNLTPFVFGGLIGVGLIFVVHFKWIQLQRKQVEASTKADAGGAKQHN